MIFDIEPTICRRLDRFHNDVLLRFEPAAKRDNAVLDEVEPGSGHHIVFGVLCRSNDLLRNTKRVADFTSREFAVLQELKIAAGQFWCNDLSAALEKCRTVGSAYATFALADTRRKLLGSTPSG